MINLKHRSVEEILPVIRPLLNPDEMVSGMNDQLIVRASPHSVGQIRHMLERIDTLPRTLKITVMQDVDSETAARLTGIYGNHDGEQAGVHIVSTRTLDDDRKTQKISVLEGSRARVSVGQSVPVGQRVQSAWGTQVTTQYKAIESGFYVLPRVHGDTVTLEITAQNDALAPNQHAGDYPVTRIQNTSTTVSGHLGVWIDMAGTAQQNETDESTINTSSTSRLNEHRTVLIRVEEGN